MVTKMLLFSDVKLASEGRKKSNEGGRGGWVFCHTIVCYLLQKGYMFSMKHN